MAPKTLQTKVVIPKGLVFEWPTSQGQRVALGCAAKLTAKRPRSCAEMVSDTPLREEVAVINDFFSARLERDWSKEEGRPGTIVFSDYFGF